ncbi:MAG: LLM class F420-dependent oxidoreductase [Alphaproteobacteria bacterium]
MRVGVAFPTTEIGTDPAVIRDYAQAVEEMGFHHLTMIDHVLQEPAQPDAEEWQTYYSLKNMFHEPLVLFGFLAACTARIQLATAILILPQRPAVLVAKQAAELDILTKGRIRLGVGVGWNEVEFKALNQDFKNRGPRMEEQIALMRALWTQDRVTFEGQWHRIDDAGINPLPVQRPIPVWFGAFAPPAIRRAARLGDGWYANPFFGGLDEETRRDVAIFRQAAAEADRDPASVGLDGTLRTADKTPDQWVAEAESWRQLGASHVTVRTMKAGLTDPKAHLEVLRQFKAAWPTL